MAKIHSIRHLILAQRTKTCCYFRWTVHRVYRRQSLKALWKWLQQCNYSGRHSIIWHYVGHFLKVSYILDLTCISGNSMRIAFSYVTSLFYLNSTYKNCLKMMDTSLLTATKRSSFRVPSIQVPGTYIQA